MSSVQTNFGRIDDTGNVYVLDNGVERLIGSQPSMTNDQSFALYVKKYDDIHASVRLLEQRVKAKADTKSIVNSAKKLQAELISPAAVGDLENLRKRVSAILDSLSAEMQELEAKRELEIAEALKAREEIAAKAEAIATKSSGNVNFKKASVEMAELFEQWQKLQKDGIKVSKSKADLIWKRFSKARNTFENNKRAFFATQDQLAKTNKNAKSELVAQAEALVAKGAEASLDYRKLLDDWKKLPKTRSKADDILWEKFKAAGDAIYAAKLAKQAEDDILFAGNLEIKLALLIEAEAIDVEADLNKAKVALKSILERWDKAGKVPRDAIKATESRLKAVQEKIRKVEAELWRKNDPATIDRTNSVKSQLEAAISKLEAELAEAMKASDEKKIAKAKEELETKQAWLAIVANS
ncbi:MAG: hypothetical protein RIQ88_780 [Actinomycetota bacterium]